MADTAAHGEHPVSRGSRARLPAHPDLVVLLGLAVVFLAGLGREVLHPHVVKLDDALFLSVGHGVLARGYPFETYHTAAGLPFYDHTPLFSYLLVLPALVDNVLGTPAALATGRAMSAVFGLATVVLAYLVCRDVRGRTAGLVAGLLVAVNPYFLQLSWAMHMEVPMACFLVAGLFLLVRDRWLWAGVAIAVAVMLKEHALAFWIVAGAFVLVRAGWRQALAVTLPTVLALAAWAAAAWAINAQRLRYVLGRWLDSAGSGARYANDARFHIGWFRWTRIVAFDVGGPPLALAGVLAVVAVVRRSRVPAIVAVPLGYTLLAIVASFLIHLKEERWLVAVVPMTAIAVGMLVDWGAAARQLAADADGESGGAQTGTATSMTSPTSRTG